MGDIKLLLKEARKLIDEKNFKEAQDCCKSILRKDKQNYFGLILLGKSFQDSDQACLAYQKAIATKPDHPLAWQGLANYYERKEDNSIKIKLFPIYDEILKLAIEEDKALETLTKLGQLGCTLKNNEAIRILVDYVKKDPLAKLCEVAEKQLVDILKCNVLCRDQDISDTVEVLVKLCSREPSSSLEVIIAKVILQKNNFAEAVKEVINLEYFPRNVVLREYLCKYLCNKFVENDSFQNFAIEKYLDQITEGVENSKYPGLLKSMICYYNKLFLEAYKQCVPLINYHEADNTEATFIIKCTIKLKKWSVTQKLATNFMNKVRDNFFSIELKKFLFISLAKQENWKHAITVGKEIPYQYLNTEELALFTECCLEVNEPIDEVMKNLQPTEYYIPLQSLSLLKKEQCNETIALLEEANIDNNPLIFFYLGKAYWHLNQYEKCHINLLKAAKLDSDHTCTFLYLGYFYQYHKEDLEKAKKCLEKAYNLNNLNIDIIRSLSELYMKLQMQEADIELLNTTQKNIQNCDSWIFFRLGLHYLNNRDWENAISNFRNVIKNNQNDITAFECLADAYYGRGSFTSALRAYNKVIALDSSKTGHCLTRIGYIHNLLTQYEDAISTFENVLKIVPNSLLAMKGISETWIKIAKKKEEAKLYGSARDCVQNALNYITKAVTNTKKYVCFWKLLGDTLLFVTKFPNKYAFVYICNSFDGIQNDLKRKEKEDIFLQAISCYSYIAKQKQQIASFDLASAYLSYYHETKKIVNLHVAFNLTKVCIKEKPSAWRNWNLLGKICLFLKKYDYAQHCFIKALLVTRKWSIAKIWCNLGTLYLKLELHKLANYCFWRGQSTLPSYPQSWIGQALIAEQIRESEAMDLFRHASRLGFHSESALGYADWVCRTLRNQDCESDSDFKYIIKGLFAIPYAMDLIEWFLNFNANNACAHTIHGILKERSGLLQSALNSYQKAFENADDDNKNITLLNIGRILLRLEKYEEAVKKYKAITEASLNSTSGLALALYKQGLYEESYSAYDTALHWLSNSDDEKADLLVAMAGIVYMFKGADDAKTLLFHSIQISQKKPTAYSLFAICSLGLIHSDQSLSKLALSELQKYEKDTKYGFDIGFLKSFLQVSQENMEDAVKLLSDTLHDHPSDALLWFCMSQYLLKSSDNKARAASCCAQKAMCSAQIGDCRCEPAKMIATASIAEYMSGNCTRALLLAKKGLHMYPTQAEIWAALLLSLTPQWAERRDWILGATGYMRRHLHITRPLSRWAGLLEKKLLVAQ